MRAQQKGGLFFNMDVEVLLISVEVEGDASTIRKVVFLSIWM